MPLKTWHDASKPIQHEADLLSIIMTWMSRNLKLGMGAVRAPFLLFGRRALRTEIRVKVRNLKSQVSRPEQMSYGRETTRREKDEFRKGTAASSQLRSLLAATKRSHALDRRRFPKSGHDARGHLNHQLRSTL